MDYWVSNFHRSISFVDFSHIRVPQVVDIFVFNIEFNSNGYFFFFFRRIVSSLFRINVEEDNLKK